MADYPFKDADARTGSNVRGNALATHYEALHAAHKARHERRVREERRALASLLTKPQLRALAKIGATVRAELREATLAMHGDAAKIAELRAAARRKLVRLLAREAPGVTQWRARRRAQVREHRKLLDADAALVGSGSDHFVWGDFVLDSDSATQEFVPPFTTFDVQSLQWDNQVTRDESFAKPRIGHLVNNFDYDDDRDTSLYAGALGILIPSYGISRASCGVGFTTPAAGHLRLSAVFRNVYYRAMLSVEDSFGFSSAVTSVSVRFVFTIVRGTQVIEVPTSFRTVKVDSDGDDKSIVDTGIEDQVPFTASSFTQERFAANESLLVMAGAEIAFYSMLDDMHCRGNALAWWELDKLRLSMFEFPIT